MGMGTGMDMGMCMGGGDRLKNGEIRFNRRERGDNRSDRVVDARILN
jgi:hypothetical protein